MGFIDIVLLVIVGAFVFYGFFFGLIHTIASLIGSILGIIIASRLVDPVFEAFGFLLGGGAFARIVLFILIFFVVIKLVGIVVWFVTKVFDLLAWIPFAQTFNRLLGGVFGLIEGIVVVGVVLYYMMLVLPDDALRSMLETSNVANILIAMMSALQVFFPETVRQATQATEVIVE